MTTRDEDAQRQEARICQHLLDRHGPLLSGNALRVALGYPSLAALRQGIARGSVPVSTFMISGRRGRFALTTDVARWLTQQPTHALAATPSPTP